MKPARAGLLFLTSGLYIGGAERHTLSLANGMSSDEFALHFCYLKRDETMLADLDASRMDSVFCGEVGKGVEWASVKRLAAHIEAHAIDVVLCANQFPLLYALLARRRAKRRIKVIEVFHTTLLQTPKDKLQMLFYRPLFRRADLLVYVCRNQQVYWRQHGLSARRDTVIYNGVDTEHFADTYSRAQKTAIRAEAGFGPDDYVIGICAALRPEKAHLDYLAAIARLPSSDRTARGLIIGDGPERGKIEARIRELDLTGRVTITGFKSDVRPYIATCDIMTLASHTVETFSLAALESMALGKPLVMSNVGGASEQVIPGETGFLFEAGDCATLSERLAEIRDLPMRAAMGGTAARIVRERFSLGRMIDAYSRTIRGLGGDTVSEEVRRPAPRMGRVLVSAHTYQPEGVSEGFTAAQLVAALRRRGHRMTVLTAALPKLHYGFGILGVRCSTKTDIPYFSPANYLEYSARALLILRRLRNRFAVIHHVTPIVMRMPSFFGALRRPFIWGPIGGSVPYPPGFESYSRPHNLVNALRLLDRPRLHLDPSLRLTMHSADRIVVTTSMGAQLIPKAYRAKTQIIPEGIAENLVLPAPAGEEPYIFSSGRLIEYKAIDLLIRAFAQTRTRDIKLVITGDGPKRAELSALIDALGLGQRVKLLGRVSREENHRLMSRALFCVFPALREAFGHVNLEAMAAWKAVIATDWGGPRDLIVDGVTGIKVLGRNPAEHEAALTAAMERLIDDGPLRLRMGVAAAERVRQQFVWPVLAEKYEALYGELAG